MSYSAIVGEQQQMSQYHSPSPHRVALVFLQPLLFLHYSLVDSCAVFTINTLEVEDDTRMYQEPITQNTLFYGDNLKVLREHIQTHSVDLLYLDSLCYQKARYLKMQILHIR